jgi:flagellar assembly protein FliH
MGTPFRIKAPLIIKDNDVNDNYINDNYINDNDVNNSNSFITESEESQYFANSVDVEEAIQMIQREANIIIKEAEDEAQRILEESKEDAQKSKIEIEKAKAKGYEDGRKEAQLIKEKAIEEYGQILNNIENDIVDIILDISRKVLYTEKIQTKNVIFNLVREAIDNCTYKNEVILRVSPYEYNYIMQNKDELDLILGDIDNFEVRKDSSLQNGDCIIETPYGCIDTSINTKLNKIEKAFKEICNIQNITNGYAYVREEY